MRGAPAASSRLARGSASEQGLPWLSDHLELPVGGRALLHRPPLSLDVLPSRPRERTPQGLHRLQHSRYESVGRLLSSKIKPAGGCFIVGLIDRKLLLVNNELEIIPLEIKEPLFAFYLLLKHNEKELALDMVKSADYRLQETYARIALVSFGVIISTSLTST